MWLKALLISILFTCAVVHGQGIIPIARDTSRASKNLLSQSRLIQRQIDGIRQYLDSNFVQWGSGTLVHRGNLDSLVVVLPVKYSDSLYTIVTTPRSRNTVYEAYLSTGYAALDPVTVSLSDSSFVVIGWNYDPSNYTFDVTWTTVGIRKKE
jgi:hypothetical protein